MRRYANGFSTMLGEVRLLSLAYWDELIMTLPDWKQIRRAGAMGIAGASALLVAGCNQFANIPKHLRPLSSSTQVLLENKGMEKDSPILLRIFKEDAELEVWKKQKQTGKYALLNTYDICKWSGELGPKFREGDRQAPEGFYTVTPAQMNPKSSYHLSFNLGFPNAYDKANGRTGSHLMVHGACSSRGCYSMDDDQIQEIYTLARLAFQGGQRSFQVQAYPFRMTPANIAKNRKSPHIDFWKMLKEGHDHFQVTGQPPKIDVCSKRYVFNAVPQAGVKFSPTAECPELSVPDPIRLAVADRQRRDQTKTEEIIARLDARENGRGPLRSLFGNTAVASAEPAPQSAPASFVVASEPTPQPKPTSPVAKKRPVPEQPAESEGGIATAYSLETEDTGSDGFISALMKRIW